MPRSAHSAADLASRLGRQRESLAAIRNVEQLLASLHAGPKVIESLVPEVRQLIGPMRMDTEQLQLALDEGKGSPVRALGEHEQSLLDQLESALAECVGTLTAKKRLALERHVRTVTPELGRIVEHWELLVESVTGGGVTLPLGELLSSRPDHGSSRPLRRLLVFGAPVDVLVTLPPRAALGALSLLAETSRTTSAPALYVAREPGSLISLEFKPPQASGSGSLTCMIPFHGPLPISREVALWVLVRIGALPFQAADARIRLPIHAPGG